MDVMVKMARFQIKQNVSNLKSTLEYEHYLVFGTMPEKSKYLILNYPFLPSITHLNNSDVTNYI